MKKEKEMEVVMEVAEKEKGDEHLCRRFKFLFKKHNICKFCGISLFLFDVCTRPAVENNLSEFTDNGLYDKYPSANTPKPVTRFPESVVDPVLKRNSYFAHPENLLLSMLTDNKKLIQEIAAIGLESHLTKEIFTMDRLPSSHKRFASKIPFCTP
ncbi:unnamed protein product [Brassicogethes aeneus]|uniref:Uncharacterized protein n=1 Tax=Brassicogethes aeneus TaxID=1431903 RepID=A0A9P0FG91_BRAAE|nr:unnamed protein product [Brassicogethes aeneus]